MNQIEIEEIINGFEERENKRLSPSGRSHHLTPDRTLERTSNVSKKVKLIDLNMLQEEGKDLNIKDALFEKNSSDIRKKLKIKIRKDEVFDPFYFETNNPVLTKAQVEKCTFINYLIPTNRTSNRVNSPKTNIKSKNNTSLLKI